MNSEIISDTYPFPPRAHVAIQEIAAKETKLPPIPLSEFEQQRLSEFEQTLTRSQNLWHDLGHEFRNQFQDAYPDYDLDTLGIEPIYISPSLKVITANFMLEYFLTREGQAHLQETFSLEQPIEFNHREHVARFLATFPYDPNHQTFTKKLKGLEGASKEHVVNTMATQLLETPLEEIDNPTQFTVTQNPQTLIDRFHQYRQLRHFHRQLGSALKEQIRQATSEGQQNHLAQAKLVILNQQRRRLGELIALDYPKTTHFLDQAKIIQDDPVASIELKHRWNQYVDEIQSLTPPQLQQPSKQPRSLSRLDKFAHGIGEPYPPDADVIPGDATPIDSSARRLTEDLSQQIGTKSPELTHLETAASTTADQWHDCAAKYLDHLDILSTEPEAEYDPNRAGPASDNRWQVVTREDKTNLSINSKQKVIVIPRIWQYSLPDAITKLDHELQHVIQHENKSRIDLALFDVVGMDRSKVYTESGAIAWEAEAYLEFFDYYRTANPDYHQAARARLKGGTLKDCAYAFYQSYSRKHTEEPPLSRARHAIDRAMRLFRKSGVYDSDNPYLPNSDPLKYLEQELLGQALKQTEYDWLSNFAGINLQTALELQQIGRLNLDDLIIPQKRPSEYFQR